jgi:RNA polymerase sigma-70 factor (ECF subfamily)
MVSAKKQSVLGGFKPAYSGMDETELIVECQRGDLEAFNELIQRYQSRLLNLVNRFLRNPEHSRDAAQDIFIKVFEKLYTYKGQAAFWTWLYRIASNHCLTLLAKAKRYSGTSLEALMENEIPMQLSDPRAPNPETVLLDDRRRRELVAMLGALPPHYYQALVLSHFEELSYDEIALIMNRPVNTIASYLHRARKRIKSQLEAKAGGEA